MPSGQGNLITTQQSPVLGHTRLHCGPESGSTLGLEDQSRLAVSLEDVNSRRLLSHPLRSP